MESKRPKGNQFVGPKSDVGCRKHPKHRQSPGVCSVCLGERLSQISTGSGSKTHKKTRASSSWSSSSLSSSCYSSSEPSPIHHRYRLASMKNVTNSGFLRGKEDVFRKSRSMAAIERERERKGEERERKNKKKKKNGFWAKLLRPRRKKAEEGLMHTDMKERVIATRVH